ncbi:MAG: hypothetical protein L0387_07980 [Acidobacteria bacterium]|nr:hypothetical protein [Acidobacteriota bacterium]MCI0718128.1 hypothetical protein [Acidobacteriota bacterium]
MIHKPTLRQLTEDLRRLNKEIGDLSTSTHDMIANGPHRHLWGDVFDVDSNGELFATRQLVNAEFSAYYARANKVKRLQHDRDEVEKALAELANKPKSRRKKPLTEKQKAIRQAIKKTLHGIEYCKSLVGIETCPEWQENGCPGVYTNAYKDPEWRIKIQQEKHREAKKLKRESSK